MHNFWNKKWLKYFSLSFNCYVSHLIFHNIKLFLILVIWLNLLQAFYFKKIVFSEFQQILHLSWCIACGRVPLLPHSDQLFQQFYILIYSVKTRNFEKFSKIFKISITYLWFLTRKVISSSYAVYKKSCSSILSLSMFWFDLITANTISNTSMNK